LTIVCVVAASPLRWAAEVRSLISLLRPTARTTASSAWSEKALRTF